MDSRTLMSVEGLPQDVTESAMTSNAPLLRTVLAVPYPRPAQLSDPENEFTDDFRRAILAKSDADLTWEDLQAIHGPFLPAGTYEEGAYFLPLALNHIAAHEDSAPELLPGIAWFISVHADRLESDHALIPARECLEECLQLWTSRFEVVHLDHVACRALGRGVTYADYVKNSTTICICTSELAKFVRHLDLAEDFFRSLAGFGSDPTKAAWFLEMARSQIDVFTPPDTEAIRQLLENTALLQSAAAIVKAELVANENSPTYWSDTLALVETSPNPHA